MTPSTIHGGQQASLARALRQLAAGGQRTDPRDTMSIVFGLGVGVKDGKDWREGRGRVRRYGGGRVRR